MNRPSSSTYDPRFFERLQAAEERHFWFLSRSRLIARLAEQLVSTLRPGYRVLEVGCGTGRWLEHAVRQGAEIVGLDFCAEMLARAAAKPGLASKLAVADAARLRVSEGLLESQLGSQALERWARAELLVRLGRAQQALPWYASLAETSIDGLIYLAPAELRQAEIWDSLGNGRAAAAHYARFVELWTNADVELRPQVERARKRLTALRALSAR